MVEAMERPRRIPLNDTSYVPDKPPWVELRAHDADNDNPSETLFFVLDMNTHFIRPGQF